MTQEETKVHHKMVKSRDEIKSRPDANDKNGVVKKGYFDENPDDSVSR